jgi:glycosyltransferase involved in cell wall biosynthesis
MSGREIYTFGFRGFPDVQGGIETHAEHLAPRLVELGYRVTACTRSPYAPAGGERSWKGVKLLRLWTVRSTYFETLLHSLVCAVVAGFRRPDIVHVHGIGPALVTPLLRLLGLRVVVTHHGEDYNREKWGWAARTILRAGENAGMCFAHKRIAVSRSIQTLITTKYGRNSEVIPNGVEFPEVPLGAGTVTALGLTAGKYVLTVGRLVPEKRQLDLLRAFRAARLDGWKLAIVGRVDHENRYAERLATEAQGGGDVVMAGYQSGEALRQLYAHAGLFVLPSSHEGLPIVLLEALSYGLPALVSDIPSNMEVVSDPAYVFKMGDVDDLTGKLWRLAGVRLDAEARETIRRDSARKYNWTDIAVKTAAAYGELTGAKRASTGLRPASLGEQTVPGASMLKELGHVSEVIGGLSKTTRL